MEELRGESWRARAPKPKGSVQARSVGITARGADRVVAGQGSDPLPALGRTRPWFLRCDVINTYELLKNCGSRETTWVSPMQSIVAR